MQRNAIIAVVIAITGLLAGVTLLNIPQGIATAELDAICAANLWDKRCPELNKRCPRQIVTVAPGVFGTFEPGPCRGKLFRWRRLEDGVPLLIRWQGDEGPSEFIWESGYAPPKYDGQVASISIKNLGIRTTTVFFYFP